MYYWVYGFAVRSEFELPELRVISMEEAACAPPPIVEIVAGRVPTSLPGERRLASWMSFTDKIGLFTIDDVARLSVSEGRKIVVDMEAGALEGDMRAYLIGSGLGTICHQRGLLPLHVSAVLAPEGAIAFTGPSGAGKSTTAATLNAEHGWPIVSDDVAVVRLMDKSVVLQAGVMRCRLWKDAADRLGFPVERLTRDVNRYDKFQIDAADLFTADPQTLHSLVDLKSEVLEGSIGDHFVLLNGSDKFACVLNAIYRPYIASIYQDRAKLHRLAADVCSRIQVIQCARQMIVDNHGRDFLAKLGHP